MMRSSLGSLVGAIVAGFAGETNGVMVDAPALMRAGARRYIGGRMNRRSVLSPNQRSYHYDPFTPAPMSAYWEGNPSRQVVRQYRRRLAKVARSREKREARAA